MTLLSLHAFLKVGLALMLEFEALDTDMLDLNMRHRSLGAREKNLWKYIIETQPTLVWFVSDSCCSLNLGRYFPAQAACIHQSFHV